MKNIKIQLIAFICILLIVSMPVSFADQISPASAAEDKTPPFITSDIQKYYNQKRIIISGATEPFAEVRLYINDLTIPARIIDKSIVGASGSFEFRDVLLNDENVIVLSAIDQSGNKNDSPYYVSVDTKTPVLTIDALPAVATNKTVIIKGSVNEESTIRFYAAQGRVDNEPPLKVTGLINSTLGSNVIEIEWNESLSTDISKYIIYRDDVGAIAMTNKGYTSYPDYLVSSNKSYTYSVAVRDTSGNIGAKSSKLTIKTPAGGRPNVTLPKEIDTTVEEQIKETLNTTGAFAIKFEATKGDGPYHIKIEAVDKALNKASIEKEITIDTTPPKIRITSPPAGTSIYENFANEVKIIGETEPSAEVHLYVSRTPLGWLNDSADIAGIPSQIQNIPEAKLRASCRSGGLGICPTGADYSTNADSKGIFNFDKVDLTTTVGFGYNLNQVKPQDLSRQNELGIPPIESKRANILLVASDSSKHRTASKTSYQIATCWSGDFDWDVTSLIEHQSPTLLSTQRISSGEEYIYFYLRFDYHGVGEEAEIASITLANACQGEETTGDERFNTACKLMQSSTIQPVLNDVKDTAYFTVKLNKLDGMDKWMEDDWKAFFDAIGNEVTFPFKLRIDYRYKTSGEPKQKIQTTCIPITYVIDKSRINFKDVLPDWVMYDFVDFLNSSIQEIRDVQEQIYTVVQYVGIACVSSFLVRLAIQIYRRWSCTYEEMYRKLEKFTELFGTQTDKQDKCNQCIQGQANLKDKDLKNVKTDEISDTCLKECSPSCSAAWESEASVYSLYRWSCDRLFGHSTPSKWTETVSDDDLNQKKEEGSSCKKDLSVLGRTILAVKCRTLTDFKEAQSRGIDETCFEIYEANENQKTLYVLGDKVPQSSDLYYLNFIKGPSQVQYRYALKSTDTQYTIPQGKTCKEVCGIKGDSSPTEEERPTFGKYELSRAKEGTKEAWCMTTNECTSLTEIPGKDGKKIKVNLAIPRGYSNTCFYAPGKSIDVVSEDPAKGEQCCCVTTGKAESTTSYYLPNDVETKDGKSPGNNNGLEAENYKNMLWSYRYSKIKYEVRDSPTGKPRNQYNPSRYIEGRDQSACFGQNNWFFDGFNTEEITPGTTSSGGKLLIIDPVKQHTSAFQCLNIGGINQRLQMITNFMGALQTCLVQVRTLGYADAGVCKELFTKYICSFIWQIISYIRDGCLPFGSGISMGDEKADEGVMKAVQTGVRSIFDSVKDSQTEIMEEYKNTKITNLLGIGEEEVARKICLAAFGYDWELNLKDVLDAAYSQPMETLVMAVLPTREYLTIDPDTSQARYEYRLSWLINPGCDMDRYDVYLSCVSNNEISSYKGIDCTQVKDPKGSDCDCAGQPKEQLRKLKFTGPKLAQNSLEDRAYPEIVTSPYRYDHLKFVLKPTKGAAQARLSTSTVDFAKQCFPDGYYYGGNGIFYFPIMDKTAYDIVDCRVDITTGTFTCNAGSSFWSKKGTAYFQDVKILLNGVEHTIKKQEGSSDAAETVTEVFKGDRIEFQPTIYNQGPEHCLLVTLEKANKEKTVRFMPIDINGTHKYPSIPLADSVELTGRVLLRSNLIKCDLPVSALCPADGRLKENSDFFLVSQENIEQKNFQLIFSDDSDEDNIITINQESTDKLAIDAVGRTIKEWVSLQENIANPNRIYSDDKGGAKFYINIAGQTYKNKTVEYNIIVPPKNQGAILEEPWTIYYDIYNLKENSTTCDGSNYNSASPALYQKKAQKFSQRLDVKSELLKAKRVDECVGNGAKEMIIPCDCDGGGINYDELTTKDCLKDRYCYRDKEASTKSCHENPKT